MARLRTTDVVARWAGSELAVLLPRAGSDEVPVVAEKLAGIVGETGTRRVPPGSLSPAIGVAPVPAVPAEAGLVARAIQALTEARRQGGGWAVATH